MWASGRKCRRACTRSSRRGALSVDCPIIFKVFGEMSLYCNVKDVGLVSITGCCHQGIILFADTAYKELAYEKDQFYACTAAAYLAFDDWDRSTTTSSSAQEVEPPAGRLQPLHGPHHRPEVRGRGLSGGEGHGPVPLQDHQLPRQRRRHQVPRLR